MNYLLDTCVISELAKPHPHAPVVKWVSGISDEYLYLSVLTLGELQHGISRLPESARRNRLQTWVDKDIHAQFEGRILSVNDDVSLHWGAMRGTLEQTGVKLPVIDGLIAATALTYGMTIVTRNTSDMVRSKVVLIDPMERITRSVKI